MTQRQQCAACCRLEMLWNCARPKQVKVFGQGMPSKCSAAAFVDTAAVVADASYPVLFALHLASYVLRCNTFTSQPSRFR